MYIFLPGTTVPGSFYGMGSTINYHVYAQCNGVNVGAIIDSDCMLATGKH